MRICSPPVRHAVDIDSLESLADVIGLTIGEIETALYGRPTLRRRCCARMLAACLDAEVIARCSGDVCEKLGRHLSAA